MQVDSVSILLVDFGSIPVSKSEFFTISSINVWYSSPRLIADFIYIAAIDCILIGKDLIAVGGTLGIDRKVLILFPEAFVLIFLQAAEHTAIVHVVSVDDVVKVGKIRLIQSFQKDTSGDMLIAMDIFAQIFFVVPGVHDRIVDANLILIVEPYPADDVRVFCF